MLGEYHIFSAGLGHGGRSTSPSHRLSPQKGGGNLMKVTPLKRRILVTIIASFYCWLGKTPDMVGLGVIVRWFGWKLLVGKTPYMVVIVRWFVSISTAGWDDVLGWLVDSCTAEA